jgi:glutamate 5-kinase
VKYSRVVIKVGSAVLSENGALNLERIYNLAELISSLIKIGKDVILVSSGAVSAGYIKLQLDRGRVENRQALAAIGQSYLMSIYQKKFSKFGITISQILLTQADFDSRKRSRNIENTINVLLQNGVLPIINENDSVAIDELLFGDNDQLSAYVAYYLKADLLVILSDIDGYYDKDPSKNTDAKIRKVVTRISDHEIQQEYNPNNSFATGGIVTKLKAAKFLTEKGKRMYLASGFDLQDARDFLFKGEAEKGTLFI